MWQPQGTAQPTSELVFRARCRWTVFSGPTEHSSPAWQGKCLVSYGPINTGVFWNERRQCEKEENCFCIQGNAPITMECPCMSQKTACKVHWWKKKNLTIRPYCTALLDSTAQQPLCLECSSQCEQDLKTSQAIQIWINSRETDQVPSK